MGTDAFIDMIAPEVLYAAIEPIAPPVGTGSCTEHDPVRFASPGRQQKAFDGEAEDPEKDYPAARALCLGCPLLEDCRDYADRSGEGHTFLAGQTAEQRLASRSKRSEIAKRRLQVQNLHRLGAGTRVVADIVQRDPSLVRSDLRALARQTGAPV
ncbi:WhiB family transcriptional regulator [Streptacidiphilus cavernicola]|uniref:WhiB family transcriptional regulator n=1 Tax=Streptacidiphilus cavernicola TaxID=3342716 RepID=A0ABV6VUC1_9ACTN